MTAVPGAAGGDDRFRRLLLGALVLGLAASITLAEVALALLIVRLVWRLWTGRARLEGWPLAVPVLAWIAVSLVAALASARPVESVVAAKDLLLIATLYVVLDALPDAEAAARFVTGLLAAMAVVAVVAIVQVAFCPQLEPLGRSSTSFPVVGRWITRVLTKCHRAHGFYSIYMTLAGALSLTLLVALPAMLPFTWSREATNEGPAPDSERRHAWPRWRHAAWLVGGVALALTYVRGAWVGFIAGAALLLGLVRRGRIVLLGAIVLLALVVVVVPGLRERAESIVDPADPTARERMAMWRSGIAMAWEHPLTGLGPGQLKRHYPRYAAPDAKPRGHLHNTPLQVLVERGLLGLGAWIAIFAVFLWRAGRVLQRLGPDAWLERALVTGSLAAVVGFLVGGLTEYNFGDSEVVLVAYAVMALPFVVVRWGTRTQPEPIRRAGA